MSPVAKYDKVDPISRASASQRVRRQLLAVVGGILALLFVVAPARAAMPSASSDLGYAAGGPGTFRGLADPGGVSFSAGSFDYPLPLELPSYGDLVPELSIQYSSAFGNGLLGQGWSLLVPKIRRSTRNGVPSMTSSDKLELLGLGEGSLLVPDPTTGGYWLEGRGRGLRIQPVSDYFVVTDNHGTQYTFGQSGSARLVSGSTVVEWHLQTIANLAGATVTYAYSADQNQVYLNSVKWGPTVSGAPAFSLDLTFVARPDVFTSYRIGTKVVTASRLDKLTLSSFSTVVSTVKLNYAADIQSRVTSIVRTGRNNATGLPTVTFGYTSGSSLGMSAGPTFTGWEVGTSPNVMLLDVDRDGYPDLFRVTGSSPPVCEYRRNLAGGATFAEATTMSSCPLSDMVAGKFVDIDGDGFTDYAVPTTSGADWHYHTLSYGDFWDAGTWPGSGAIGPQPHFADVNGDGRVDAISTPGSSVQVQFNTASGFDWPISIARSEANGTTTYSGDHLCDLNHDGLIDRVDFGSNGLLTYYYGKGNGTFENVRSATYARHQPDNQLLFNDFDGDGMTDLVEVDPSQFYFSRGQANHVFQAPTTFSNPTGSPAATTTADINGNGSTDLIAFSPSGALFYNDKAGAAGTGPSLVQQVDNGLGARILVSYRAISEVQHEDEDAGQTWWSTLPFSFPVVSRVQTIPGGSDATRITDYHPQNPDWDAAGREFLGFEQMVTTELAEVAANNLVTTHAYNTGSWDYYRELRGRETYTARHDGLGNWLNVTYTDWQVTAVPGLPSDYRAQVPILAGIWSSSFGPSGSISTSTTFDYDGEGRVIRTIESGRTDMEGDERITEFDYVVADDTKWLRDLPCAKRLKKGDWSSVGDTRIYYGDNNSEVAPLCTPGSLGWQRLVEGYWDFADSYVRLWSATYDSLKNPLGLSDGNVTTIFGYDDYGLHATSRTLYPTSSTALTWSYVWDNALGRVKQVTSPDGVVDHIGLDDLGRVSSVSKDSLPAHLRYTYDITGDLSTSMLPKYNAYVFDGSEADMTSPAQAWPNGSKWRSTTHAFSGLMEPRYEAVKVGPSNFAISGFKTRDGRGNVFSVGIPFYFSSDMLGYMPFGVGAYASSYDALNRRVLQQAPSGDSVSNIYDAGMRTVSRTGQSDEIYTFDGFGRPIASFRALDWAYQTTDLTYDIFNHVTRISRQAGQVVSTYTYDSLGRITSASDPDSGRQGWYYINASQVSHYVNGNGDQEWYHYDDAGRLARSGMGVVMDEEKDYVYNYDVPLSGTAESRRTNGRLAWVHEPEGGQVELGYDRFGHRNWTNRTVRGETSAENFGFAPSGLRLHEDADDGFSIDYAYDGGGRLTQAGPYWRSTELNAAGSSLTDVFGNGLTQTNVLDLMDLPSRVTLRAGSAPPVFDVGITRTLQEHPETVTDYDGVGMDHTSWYFYDTAARLTEVDFTENYYGYGYDTLENFTYRYTASNNGTMASGTYNYGGPGFGPRQLASVTPWNEGTQPTSFTYDRAGRMTKEFDSTLSYNARDQLVNVTTPPGGIGPGGKPNVNVHFTYGYDGLRTATADASNIVERWFHSEHRETADGWHQHLVSAGDRLVAQVTSGWPSATRYFHQAVMVGPEIITDSAGNVLEERRYEPYGQLDSVMSASGTADMTTMPMNGLNQSSDPLTTFSFHGARWYDPQIGRWLGPDPASVVPSAGRALQPWLNHPYAYANNNPTITWDADGAEPGPANTSTKKEAVRASAIDVYVHVQTQPSGNWGKPLEYGSSGYSSGGGGYYYTAPHVGNQPHEVDIADPIGTPGAGGGNKAFIIHGHTTGSTASDADPIVAMQQGLNGVEVYVVTTDGYVYRIDPGTTPVTYVMVANIKNDPDTQFQLAMARMDQAYARESAAWNEADQQANQLYTLYKLYKDPGSIAPRAEHDLSTGCRHICWLRDFF